ncbi:MAG: cytochrome c [Deltaproteobacteria bacterium]|jgi:mono/diheme cytochrome c family protein
MAKTVLYVLVGLFLGITLLEARGNAGSEYAEGKNLYVSKCKICHGIKGDGKGPAAFALNPKPQNFTDPAFWQKDVEEKITTTITKGKGSMPAFQLKPGEIKAIIYYISHTFKPGSSSGP